MTAAKPLGVAISYLGYIAIISMFCAENSIALRVQSWCYTNEPLHRFGCNFPLIARCIPRLNSQGIMSKRVYCTYFDHNYLSRGLALYRSLQQHQPGASLWVLCMSEACHRILTALDLPDLRPVRLGDFEAADPEVAATRSNRSMIEYYFTCSPAWKLNALDNEPDAEWVTYLDSDLFFFASPEPIYAEMKDASFGIIPHHFTKRMAYRRRFGTYNVGWVSVRRCDEGIAALRWWRYCCIEWCYDFVEGDRFADQRYLDRLPGLFPNVHVVQHLGANLAPWNFADFVWSGATKPCWSTDDTRCCFFISMA